LSFINKIHDNYQFLKRRGLVYKMTTRGGSAESGGRVRRSAVRLEIQGLGSDPAGELRERVERRIAFALGRYGDRLGRVVVKLASRSPRPAPDEVACLIKVEMVSLKCMVMIEESDPDPGVALARAAQRVGMVVGRRLDADRLTS